ncbi:hypothetical protein X801_05320, partial [Opisthorchis viverrini]
MEFEFQTLNWSRSLYLGNKPFSLKLATTDDPVHRLVNYIFEILARERLGYRDVSFVYLETDDTDTDDTIRRAIDQLRCSDESCSTVPNVHLNLLLWMPGGIDVNNWAPPSSISDHGPLGPTRQWEFRTQAEFAASLRSRKHYWFSDVENSCPQNPTAYLEHISSLVSQDLQSNRTTFTGQPVTVYEWSVKDSIINSNTYKWIDPPPCEHSWASSTEHTESELISELCRTESYQAIKVSWANLSAVSPLLHTLASRIYLNDYDFEELKRKVSTGHLACCSDLWTFVFLLFHLLSIFFLRTNMNRNGSLNA